MDRGGRWRLVNGWPCLGTREGVEVAFSPFFILNSLWAELAAWVILCSHGVELIAGGLGGMECGDGSCEEDRRS